MSHTNIIAIKDRIILKKAKKKEKLSETIINTTVVAKVAQKLSLVEFA